MISPVARLTVLRDELHTQRGIVEPAFSLNQLSLTYGGIRNGYEAINQAARILVYLVDRKILFSGVSVKTVDSGSLEASDIAGRAERV
jgi:hypothetical protein